MYITIMNYLYKKKKIPILFTLFVMVCFYAYRDFLITYRMMLLDEYFLYYHYQNIIIYYETGDLKYSDNLPMNVRFLGLILQYIIFKVVPCINLTNISVNPNYDELFVCATFSLALLNYLSKYLLIILFFYYVVKILKRPLIEGSICIFLSFILINYVEDFTFDRITILYTLLILMSLNNKYLSCILITLSFLVSEKVIMIIGPLLLIKYIFLKEKKYLINLKFAILSVGLYGLMIYLLINFFNFSFSPLYENTGFDRLFLDLSNKSHISNSIIPITFCFIPYAIYLFDKNKRNLNFSVYEILLPIIMIFLGTGGGEHNIGRYAMYSFIIWLPLFASQINHYLKISKLIEDE